MIWNEATEYDYIKETEKFFNGDQLKELKKDI